MSRMASLAQATSQPLLPPRASTDDEEGGEAPAVSACPWPDSTPQPCSLKPHRLDLLPEPHTVCIARLSSVCPLQDAREQMDQLCDAAEAAGASRQPSENKERASSEGEGAAPEEEGNAVNGLAELQGESSGDVDQWADEGARAGSAGGGFGGSRLEEGFDPDFIPIGLRNASSSDHRWSGENGDDAESELLRRQMRDEAKRRSRCNTPQTLMSKPGSPRLTSRPPQWAGSSSGPRQVSNVLLQSPEKPAAAPERPQGPALRSLDLPAARQGPSGVWRGMTGRQSVAGTGAAAWRPPPTKPVTEVDLGPKKVRARLQS